MSHHERKNVNIPTSTISNAATNFTESDKGIKKSSYLNKENYTVSNTNTQLYDQTGQNIVLNKEMVGQLNPNLVHVSQLSQLNQPTQFTQLNQGMSYQAPLSGNVVQTGTTVLPEKVIVTQVPITQYNEPIVNKIAQPITQYNEPIVKKVIQPLTQVNEPIIDKVIQPIKEVVQPVVTKVVQPVNKVIEPVVTKVVQPVTKVVEPVVTKIVQPVTRVVEPVLTKVVNPVTQAADVKVIEETKVINNVTTINQSSYKDDKIVRDIRNERIQ